MTKHTKLFYRAVARIRAIGEKNGVVYPHRIRQVYKTGFERGYKLWDELIKTGVIREWGDEDLKKPRKGEKGRGNIMWENLSKFRVPKTITEIETARVNEEKLKAKQKN